MNRIIYAYHLIAAAVQNWIASAASRTMRTVGRWSNQHELEMIRLNRLRDRDRDSKD